MRSILIKDTTREERMRIVARSLDWCGQGSCENCGGCSLGVGSLEAMYRPYIDGEKEILQINAEVAARTTRLELGGGRVAGARPQVD